MKREGLYFDDLDQIPADFSDDYRPTPDDPRNAERLDDRRRGREADAVTRAPRKVVRRG